MNKLSTVALGGLLAASLSSAAYAEPTRTFFTETANTAAKGSVSLDMEYGFSETASGTGIRIGGMGGEILLNNTNSASEDGQFQSSSIGYKKTIQKNLAAYGILSYLNDDANADAYTDIALGVAFTLEQKQITININGELITDDSNATPLRGGDTTIFVKGSLEVSMDQVLPNSSMMVELALEDSDFIETASAFGFRWQPSKRVTTDLIIYVDDGDPTNGDSVMGIPGYIKLNLAF